MPTLTINVQDITSGTPVTDYKYLINVDNTGDPFSQNPDDWPSIRYKVSYSPNQAAGDASANAADVPNGKYLITVRAPGYKLGGIHVNVSGNTTATIKLNKHPLPLAKIRAKVFHDNHLVNGQDDVPIEVGLPGFHIVVEDLIGELTVDYFGNPLGTEYEKNPDGTFIFDEEGNPIPIPYTGGKVVTDANGEAVIENLPPGKYEVQAIPTDGLGWIQSSTIEGKYSFAAWVEEGNDGYMYEEGFQTPLAWFGFVKPMEWGEVKAPGTGTIKGRIRNIIEFAPPQSPLELGEPVDRPWIALNDIGGNDEQVYTGRGNRDGTFEITNVPNGLYQMVIWDEPLDYIMQFRTVQITGGNTVNMGDIGVPRWYGWIKGKVFRDVNGDGIQNTSEEGLPLVEVGTRYKDGSIQYGTVTDMMGNYSLNEVFPLELYNIAELGYARFGYTKAVSTPDFGSPSEGATVIHDRVLTLGTLTWSGTVNKIDWGMKEYPLTLPDGTVVTNGGISGIIYNATMRNETDPQFAAAEDYEPGIPNVTVNLHKLNPDGTISLLDSTTSDAWEHPIGCARPDGTPDPRCLETATSGNQIKPGVFDGGYAFEGIPAGTYVVEVIVPYSYKILNEQSVNTSEGDDYVRIPPVQPLAGQVNHINMNMGNSYLSMPGSPPYYETSRTMKVVELGYGENAACDFFVYTDVPVPGRMIGLVTDDLNVETGPASINYGEKRGIPYLPIGIRDYNGKLITMVYTDKNGIFEVLLPSTYTANVPTPAGVAQGMYRVIGNDPGDPGNPSIGYDFNYQTLPLVFEIWPGKTTFADVALFPSAAFAGGFTQPPQCSISPDTPEIHTLDKVHASLPATGANRTINITGTGFGTTIGEVTLDGNGIQILNWSNTQITARIPTSAQGGPRQLLVKRSNGKVSPYGITFHVLRGFYNPRIINVNAGGSIQASIDGAPNDSLIILSPGTYYESPIIYKNIKLQGKGAYNTIIDGRFFMSYKASWESKLASINYDGPRIESMGQAITVVAKSNTFKLTFRPQIDGITITGARGQSAGGTLINAYGRYFIISNNIIRNNGGGFGGAITLGMPYRESNLNSNILIHHNRILHNGGVSLAGAIGIFNGANNYEISYNEICGNYSAEYGGGISHFGYSPGGKIHHNKVQFNASFDEGGGIMIAGELPVAPSVLSEGAGKVDIYNNYVVFNVSNDDGGGIRFLMAGRAAFNITNNIVANNVAADLGGGISLDDASDVRIINNTIAKNVSTATAEDSDGQPHGAGLTSEGHSAPFLASLPAGSSDFSNAVLLNNIFWDNRAYRFDYTTGTLDPNYQVIDMEVFGTLVPRTFTPNYCYLSRSYNGGRRNIIYNGNNPPRFVQEYTTLIEAQALNQQPGFISIKIIIEPDMNSDYHRSNNSTLRNRGANYIRIGNRTYIAPLTDIDNQIRIPGTDIGADEISFIGPGNSENFLQGIIDRFTNRIADRGRGGNDNE
ncbi:MAG: IPT/TIG domain-containing protein [Clostridia bacterium]